MELIPEWAPNIHPIIIHFPIVLLVMAVFASFVDLILSKEWISKSKIWLYVFGTLSAIIAVLSGRQAADSVSASFSAEMTMSNHSDMGHYTLWFFITYTLIQLLSIRLGKLNKKPIKILLFVIACIGLLLLLQTGDLGGKLVYKYGVGVSK